MAEIPLFFVPGATSENQEAAYGGFANLCGRPVPPRSERIYSITFVHDGVEWIATVGATLSGIARRVTGRGRKQVEHREPVADPATVLAIFSGVPFMVVTNHRFAENVRSAWENPFLAGEPRSVKYFAERS